MMSDGDCNDRRGHLISNIWRYWGEISEVKDFFMDPLPEQTSSIESDLDFMEALHRLARTTKNQIRIAREELLSQLYRRAIQETCRIEDLKVTVKDLDETEKHIRLKPALEDWRESEETRKRTEIWESELAKSTVKKHEAHIKALYKELSKRERVYTGRRELSSSDNKRGRLRSSAREPSQRRRRRTASPNRSRCRENLTSEIRTPSIPPQHSRLQSPTPLSERPVHQPSNSHCLCECAIEMSTLVAEPPGASFDEQVEVRAETVRMLGAQEDYYEAVRRKMLARYLVRVQLYEKKAIKIRKRVVEREINQSGRVDKGKERERSDY